MELLMATEPDAADMFGVSRKQRVPIDRSHAGGVDQGLPLAARIGRLDPLRRSNELGGGTG